MRTYKVKFFGAEKPKQQLKQIKTTVTVADRAAVLPHLQRKYAVVNGLKIGAEVSEPEQIFFQHGREEK